MGKICAAFVRLCCRHGKPRQDKTIQDRNRLHPPDCDLPHDIPSLVNTRTLVTIAIRNHAAGFYSLATVPSNKPPARRRRRRRIIRSIPHRLMHRRCKLDRRPLAHLISRRRRPPIENGIKAPEPRRTQNPARWCRGRGRATDSRLAHSVAGSGAHVEILGCDGKMGARDDESRHMDFGCVAGVFPEVTRIVSGDGSRSGWRRRPCGERRCRECLCRRLEARVSCL